MVWLADAYVLYGFELPVIMGYKRGRLDVA
jgi:hypothetical protein